MAIVAEDGFYLPTCLLAAAEGQATEPIPSYEVTCRLQMLGCSPSQAAPESELCA